MNKPGAVEHICNPSCARGIGRRIAIQACLVKKQDILFEK
jgi:hypothetical protein